MERVQARRARKDRIVISDNSVTGFGAQAQGVPSSESRSAACLFTGIYGLSEEGAATALTLARGVVVEGRSRYETPWETFSTIEQVLARLDESRRMRLSMLDAWPDQPRLEVNYTPIPPLGPLNAITRFTLGLGHDHAHLRQLREIAAQVRRARAS